jgi:multimeric flavodoxin WrbA
MGDGGEDRPDGPDVPEIRKDQPSVQLDRATFEARLRHRFFDPAFEGVEDEVARVVAVAWDAYHAYRKTPRTVKAGPGFADPEAELSVEWLAARDAIRAAEARQKDPASPSRVLVVNGAARSNQTCPGESSKSYRLATLAKETLEAEPGFEVDLLDLSLLTAEYGKLIHPCKTCVSTAMPLCHWPCSCYPNHALGQAQDWMNELYPRWVAAHGVIVVSPVNWYQAPSTLKLMMDRLVCADGGNPDPTSTGGKDPAKAKALELAGWPYPRHLAGRAFGVVVHGDADGVETLRHALTSWLADMQLVPAGPGAELGRYVGYYEPYATSHVALDRDVAFQEEVRNVARAVAARVRALRAGRNTPGGARLDDPRPK